jgi:hypothetical protein|nr:hypothetical protein [Granulicella aggregans]
MAEKRGKFVEIAPVLYGPRCKGVTQIVDLDAMSRFHNYSFGNIL